LIWGTIDGARPALAACSSEIEARKEALSCISNVFVDMSQALFESMDFETADPDLTADSPSEVFVVTGEFTFWHAAAGTGMLYAACL
jgi:hypothetical protein